MARYRLPDDLTPDEERTVLAALERALGSGRERPAAWVLAGRVAALRLGALQARRQAVDPWKLRGDVPFARRGVATQSGRGDAR
jgi:hypothetical protein